VYKGQVMDGQVCLKFVTLGELPWVSCIQPMIASTNTLIGEKNRGSQLCV